MNNKFCKNFDCWYHNKQKDNQCKNDIDDFKNCKYIIKKDGLKWYDRKFKVGMYVRKGYAICGVIKTITDEGLCIEEIQPHNGNVHKIKYAEFDNWWKIDCSIEYRLNKLKELEQANLNRCAKTLDELQEEKRKELEEIYENKNGNRGYHTLTDVFGNPI